MSQMGGAGTVALVPAVTARSFGRRGPAGRFDLVPDLGRDLFSLQWWRGLATCIGLCAAAVSLAPGMDAVPGRATPLLTDTQFDQLRAQMVTPIAMGADSGIHMGPTDAVAPLDHAPERPTVDLDAVIGQGDNFARLLVRAGVGGGDARQVLALMGAAVDPNAIEPGTRVRITLGRRSSRTMPRPLDTLSVRARLDLGIEIARRNGLLSIREVPIAVDDTPLRIRGTVGGSLYAAARAAGADPTTIQSYLRVIAQRLSIESGLGANDRFDMVVAHRRASTGETETGRLLFAGLDRAGDRPIAMLRWGSGGGDQFFEASGVGERRNLMTAPVAGRLTSGFGMRYHPLLGYARMHQGVDYGAAWGTPIHASADGVVVFAGRHGGHGNFVRIAHGGGVGTGYGHMSRIAASVGERVRQGEVIGYVGSTGLSTGPHLHYEVYRNGAAVNPLGMRFAQTAQLAGAELAAFRAKLAQLRALPVGLASAAPRPVPAASSRPAELASGDVMVMPTGEIRRAR